MAVQMKADVVIDVQLLRVTYANRCLCANAAGQKAAAKNLSHETALQAIECGGCCCRIGEIKGGGAITGLVNSQLHQRRWWC